MGGCCAAVASCWWWVKKQWMALFFEKIAVASGALEKQAIRFQTIAENPIRLDVAIAGTFPGSDESMVTVSGFQGSPPKPRQEGPLSIFSKSLPCFLSFFNGRDLKQKTTERVGSPAGLRQRKIIFLKRTKPD
jgi:hypothetical protein